MMEYFLLIIEYHLIQRWKILKTVCLSIVLGLCVYYLSNDSFYFQHAVEYQNNITTVLGILIGFTISVFAILLSVENGSIREAKKKETEIIVYSRHVYLYETLLVELAFVIIIQGFLLISDFVYPVFVDVATKTGKVFFSISISLTTYSILLLLRNVLNFYFILTKKEKNGNVKN